MLSNHADNIDNVPYSSSRFKWKIENVSKLHEENRFSPIFTIGPDKWRLLAFRRGCDMNGYLSLYVVSIECKNWRFAKFSLAVIDQTNDKNTLRKDTEDMFRFTEVESDWGFDEFIQLKELKDPSNGYIVNDACIVEVDFCLGIIKDFKEESVPMELMESIEERDLVTMSIQQCDTHRKLDGTTNEQLADKESATKVQERLFGVESMASTSNLLASTSVCLENNSAFICAFCQTCTISKGSGSILHIANGEEVVEEEISRPNVIHVHRKCVEGAPRVYYVGNKVMNLELELARVSKIKCCCCGLKGAALGCFIRSCNNTYHVPCAFDTSGCRWDDEGRLMLCPSHSGTTFSHEKTEKGKMLAKDNSSAVQSSPLFTMSSRRKRNRIPVPVPEPAPQGDWSHNLSYEFANPVQVSGRGVATDPISKHLERDHLFKLRGGWSEILDVYASLPDSIKERVQRYPWKRFYFINLRRHRTQCIQVLIERWWPNTHTFHFTDFEIGITPLDLYFIAGIPCEGNLVPFDQSKWLSGGRWAQALPLYTSDPQASKIHLELKGGGIPIAGLKAFLGRKANSLNTDEYEEIERVFLLWVLGQCFFPNPCSAAKVGWLEALEDLEVAPYLDWGSAILAELYIALDTCYKNKKNMNGFWGIIEYWWYTYFRVCGPTLVNKDKQFPILMMYDESNWAPRQIDDGYGSSMAHRFLQIQRTSRNVALHPYRGYKEYEQDVAQRLENYSLHRMVLFSPCSNIGVWYMGERFLLQIRNIRAKAANPPVQTQVSRTEYERMFADESDWDFWDVNCQMVRDESEYLNWYSQISKPPICTEAQHICSWESSTPSRIGGGQGINPSHPPEKPCLHTYPTEGTSSSSGSNWPAMVWEVPIINTQGGD